MQIISYNYVLLRMWHRRHHCCIRNIQHVPIVVKTAYIARPFQNPEQSAFLEIAELISEGEVGVAKDLRQQ